MRNDCNSGITCPCTGSCTTCTGNCGIWQNGCATPCANPCVPQCGTGCTGVCNGGCNCTSCQNGGCGGDCANQTLGYLLPRITGVGRIWQRHYSTTLCVGDLPECAEGCFTLVSVSACDQATWDVLPGESGRPHLVRLTIPLSVQVRDGSCTLRTGHATITLEVPLRLHCPAQDMWRGTMLICPSVRLVSAPCPSQDACFEVVLEVMAEVYMVRWEPNLQNGIADWCNLTPDRPNRPNRPGCGNNTCCK